MSAQTQQKPTGQHLAPIDAMKKDIAACEDQFSKALPGHIPAAKFVRTVQTALSLNPDIVKCTRESVLAACMRAASDGLILDGREAALVTFKKNMKKAKNAPDEWVDMAQYMPMVAGLIKRARNSGELSTLSAYVVYANDEFEYELGDNEHIRHKPIITAERGNPILVYAIAHLKDGAIMREVMTMEEIRQVMQASKSVDTSSGNAKPGTPWAKWWSEMARKSVIRRLSKRLPISSDLSSVFAADDDYYDVKTVVDQEAAIPPQSRRKTADKKAGLAAERLKGADAPATPEPTIQDADFDEVPAGEGGAAPGDGEEEELGEGDLV